MEVEFSWPRPYKDKPEKRKKSLLASVELYIERNRNQIRLPG